MEQIVAITKPAPVMEPALMMLPKIKSVVIVFLPYPFYTAFGKNVILLSGSSLTGRLLTI